MKALYDIDDILGRSLLPYVVLDVTAKSLRETEPGQLSGDGIYLGIETKYLSKESMNTLKLYFDDSKLTETGIEYEFNGVPIHVIFITQTYAFLKNPDFRWYMAGEYMMPNPFDEYWQVRGDLK